MAALFPVVQVCYSFRSWWKIYTLSFNYLLSTSGYKANTGQASVRGLTETTEQRESPWSISGTGSEEEGKQQH